MVHKRYKEYTDNKINFQSRNQTSHNVEKSLCYKIESGNISSLNVLYIYSNTRYSNSSRSITKIDTLCMEFILRRQNNEYLINSVNDLTFLCDTIL